MIIKNIYNAERETVSVHEGTGMAENALVYSGEEFETPLQFLIYTKLPPGASIGDHKHGDDEEVYLILKGSGTMRCEGEERKVTAGDAVLNRSGWTHGLVNDSEQDLELLVFEAER